MKKHDLTGRKRFKLTILERTENINGKTAWVALCECGNKTVIKTAEFLRGDKRRKTSCGCENHKKGDKSSHWKGVGGISSTYWSRCIDSAKRRNIDFKISIEDVANKFIEQNSKCALTGQILVLNKDASLDRIDSKIGYIISNVQWIPKDVNRMKSNFDENYFIEICKMISNIKL